MFGEEKKKKKRGKIFTARTPARKPKFSGAPAKEVGRKKELNHKMGGLFGATPKKTEPDNRPRTRAAEARTRQARMKRLDGRLI